MKNKIHTIEVENNENSICREKLLKKLERIKYLCKNKF